MTDRTDDEALVGDMGDLVGLAVRAPRWPVDGAHVSVSRVSVGTCRDDDVVFLAADGLGGLTLTSNLPTERAAALLARAAAVLRGETP